MHGAEARIFPHVELPIVLSQWGHGQCSLPSMLSDNAYELLPSSQVYQNLNVQSFTGAWSPKPGWPPTWLTSISSPHP